VMIRSLAAVALLTGVTLTMLRDSPSALMAAVLVVLLGWALGGLLPRRPDALEELRPAPQPSPGRRGPIVVPSAARVRRVPDELHPLA
jgi:hypothetical protein